MNTAPASQFPWHWPGVFPSSECLTLFSSLASREEEDKSDVFYGQTSLGGGKLQRMGKCFLADKGLLGEDLGRIVESACGHCGLNVELRAIINDSSACLLSRAYSYTSIRFSLILGTGLNMAAFLPVSGIGRPKFGVRPVGWFDQASRVIVNTELGMFGHGILPMTRWDRQLSKGHPRPDFQPLELLVSGLYLGEIVRLALIEAIDVTGMLGRVVPPSLETPYSLGADTLSLIERLARPPSLPLTSRTMLTAE